MIIILAGAAVTRYAGFEGIMHIREGNAVNRFLTSESYVSLIIKDGRQEYRTDDPLLLSSLGRNRWNSSYLIGDKKSEDSLLNIIAKPVEHFQAT